MSKELTYYNITKDVTKNDWSIIKKVCDENIPLNEKEYIIKKYAERINKFTNIQTIYFFTSISLELCEKCEEFIKNRIEALDEEILIKIILIDNEGKNINDFTNYLINQEWFKYDEKYQKFIITYNLIKDNNDKLISNEDIFKYGEYILNNLSDKKCNIMMTNIYFRNYFRLLKKHNSDYFNTFLARGYAIIDKYISNDVMLTRNMMMFDCFITSYLYDIKSFFGVDFYDGDEYDDTNAYYNSGVVYINMNLVYKTYEELKNLNPSLYLLYTLSHEMVHADQDDYIQELKRTTDNYSKLRLHNLLLSFYLRRGITELYDEKHDSFYHEYDALIRGLEILYEKCKLFTYLDKSSIKKINKKMANELLDSYYDNLSPVQFSSLNYNLNKDKLIDINDEKIISKVEIEKIESNLTDYEKFILGYDNPYLEVIKNLADGNPYFSSTNLIEDIPKLYEKYRTFFSDKDEFYKKLSNFGYCYDNNLMLLDSYLELDCSNPENLPDWYKDYPVVLADKDSVYRKKL